MRGKARINDQPALQFRFLRREEHILATLFSFSGSVDPPDHFLRSTTATFSPRRESFAFTTKLYECILCPAILCWAGVL